MKFDRPDPATAPLSDLDRALTKLVKQYRAASHVVAEQGFRPDDIDDDTLEWWVAAHNAAWRRRFEHRSAHPELKAPASGQAVAPRRQRERDPRR